MSEILTLNLNVKGVKCYVVSDEPWFRAKDVATILEYNDTDKATANNVDDDDKRELEELIDHENRGI